MKRIAFLQEGVNTFEVLISTDGSKVDIVRNQVSEFDVGIKKAVEETLREALKIGISIGEMRAENRGRPDA